MKISSDRILTTHVGSLPRPAKLEDLLYKVEFEEPYDPAELDVAVTEAVAEMVTQQRSWGLDIINDGEMSKTGYATYIQQRLGGFSGDSPSVRFDDLSNFPGYRKMLSRMAETRRLNRPCCTGEVVIRDREPLRKDLENLTAASQGSDATEFFMNAASPGVISVFQNNEYYPNDDAYLDALAGVMREEYEAIANAGFVLQIDCPDLAMGRHTEYRELSEADFLKHAAMQIEALNAALANIPADRVRMHICWGNYEGPHHLDIPFETIFDVVMKAKPQGLLVESANPRHSHEWRVFETKKLPDDKVIMPGVIDSVSNYIEHPDVVADRICSYADLVGRERVIAGADCGFATFAGIGKVDPDIAFEKFRSLARGAEIASDRLWS
ncbi:MAG: cobalamin-independent methionine synthase II family protein [Alphaproteobacteria bacterium]|nr:cobalamin-independent methionine synthase II family protein [Alphaproteobacteria bacterium]